MLNFLDNFLDRITTYRLVLYVLIGFVVIAVLLSFAGFLSYSPIRIISSVVFLVIVAWIVNKIFAFILKVPTNVESVYITALILALIVTPARSLSDFTFLFMVALLAISSKYILAINKKHLFNPAAIAVVLTAFFFQQYASWWVGTASMLPCIFIGGFLIVRKLQKTLFVTIFLLGVTFVTLFFAYSGNISLTHAVTALFLESAIVFFATVMLTEPLTLPPTKTLQLIYGGIIVLLIDPHVHVGSLYTTPELALVAGNIFSYMVSPKQKLLLTLKEKIQVGIDQIDFIFATPEKIVFTPGQYLEWTLQHKNTDSRGNRRYFTLASSPTENEVHLGVKFYPHGSSYKKALAQFGEKDLRIAAGQLAGDFVMPKDISKKLVFLAGGIGITPFRSMLKYVLDTKEKRDIVLFYSNKVVSEIMYTDVFALAEQSLGIKVVYTLTDTASVPVDWQGQVGRVTPSMLQKQVPDFMERLFYLSGPHAMVMGFEHTLQDMGVHASRIKKDFFPGFV